MVQSSDPFIPAPEKQKVQEVVAAVAREQVLVRSPVLSFIGIRPWNAVPAQFEHSAQKAMYVAGLGHAEACSRGCIGRCHMNGDRLGRQDCERIFISLVIADVDG